MSGRAYAKQIAIDPHVHAGARGRARAKVRAFSRDSWVLK